MIRYSVFLLWLLLGINARASTVLASTYGYNITDATTAFQAAIQSSFDTIIIDKQAANWNVAGNHFADINDKTIIFQPGVVLRALPGRFSGLNQCLFRLSRCNNITLIGYGATFIMNKAEYVALGDSEYRHTLSINNSTNIRILGLTLRDSGGDGIYVGGANGALETRNYSEGIFIEDVRCINHYRQGMSITSVENITVRHCVFTQTNGTLPEAGVDVEPYESYQRVVNLNFEHCVFTRNNWVGLCLALSFLDSTSIPVSIRISDCFFSQNSRPGHPYSTAELFVSADKALPVQGDVLFDRCMIDSSQWTVLYTRKTADAYALTFRDCVFKDICLDQDQQYNEPFFLEVPDYSNPCAALGGIHFDSVFISYPTAFHLLRVYGWSTLAGVKDITGQLTVLAPQGDSIWLQQVQDTINLRLEYALLDSLPQTTLEINSENPNMVECDSTPTSITVRRNSNQLDYPIAYRYKVYGSASFGDDVHIPTGMVMIPANTISRQDSLYARQDDKIEPEETFVAEPMPSTLYSTTLAPLDFTIRDCTSNSNNIVAQNVYTVLIYPNPVSDIFDIKTAFPWQRMILYDRQGQAVLQFSKTDRLTAATLPPGIYFIQLILSNTCYGQKVVLIKQ